ncbi:MAG: DUF4258 domain-containing protein [Planctomycetes bacterium]|nr:DUF4258 domain-containing protein [Planctomycetota bacterium]
MPGKPVIVSGHARFEMRRRGIREAQVVGVVRLPGQVVPSRKGRHVYQAKIASGKMLLRVVVREDTSAYHVITAYKTSKVAKYWKRP